MVDKKAAVTKTPVRLRSKFSSIKFAMTKTNARKKE